ncbi:MAG: hypothetical protein K1X91_04880 [Bacteriodetes bacterium]|nr:hypothetical protein [Bacteroidota bacterium]
MRNIKKMYWFIILTLFILTAICMCYTSENWASILLSGVALVVAGVALGLSDKKVPEFKGTVELWTKNKINTDDDEQRCTLVLQIINQSSEPVNDFMYRVRMPKTLSDSYQVNSGGHTQFTHGDSLIIIDESYGFLSASESGDGYARLDLGIKVKDIKRGNLYVTISGSNIKTATFLVHNENMLEVFNSSSNNKYQAERKH